MANDMNGNAETAGGTGIYRGKIHPHKEIIDDICSDCGRGYCILAEAISSEGYRRIRVECASCRQDCELKSEVLSKSLSDFVLEQIKCVEKFKWERNKGLNGDMGWDAAWRMWVGEGYHANYRKLYRDGMKHRELFTLVVGNSVQ